MSELLVHQLSAWLAGTDIALLELRGPGVLVRLHNDGTRVEPLPPDALLAQEGPDDIEVLAASVGLFLHTHPLHEAPLAAPGQRVGAGQTLGLLRVGALLLPVAAPRAGTFVGHAAGHGSTVGYGALLLHLAGDPLA